MLLHVPSEKFFDQSICTTKEQKTRLQCLASAMPKSVMPSVGPFKVIKFIFFMYFRQLSVTVQFDHDMPGSEDG